MESPDLQMQMIEVEAQTIIVREDLPRIRTDLGEVKKLAESFTKYGQLQPIVVNRNMELIAGGRRLAACLLSGRKAKIAFNDTVDPLTMREMELEENLQRKSLNPAEELLAIDEIHRLKQTLHGESCSGKPGIGWSMSDTAELIGKTMSSVSKDLQLADMLKQFPSLADCKTKNDIAKAAKGLQKVADRMSAIQNLETLTLTNNLYNVYKADALEDMLSIPDKSVDLLLTDPIYGIDINKLAMGVGHTSGGKPTTGFNYTDSPEEALKHYKVLAKQSFRFCTDSSHAFVFTSPTNFCALRDLFKEAGWLCSDRPIIWVKNETGQNNNPDKWFSATYEIILFARKQNSRLVVEAKGDWIQTPPIWGDQKMHQAQKPLPLLKELIQRTTLPGQSLYDPFMGSGSSIIAALDMKIFARGCDIAEESFATTMYRIKEWEAVQKIK